MQKSSFFAENEGEKGILDGYLFWSHKTFRVVITDSSYDHLYFSVFT